MRFLLLSFGCIVPLMSCAGPGGGVADGRPGLGQYQRPLYQQVQPTPFLPRRDQCGAQLYQGLIGQHEGGVVFTTLPGRSRVVKPAQPQTDEDEFLQDLRPGPPLVEIREFLSGQLLYAPTIQAVQGNDGLGPDQQDRLTIELDRQGYIRRINCR